MNNKHWDLLVMNAAIATMDPKLGGYGLIEGGAFGVSQGKVAWLGKSNELPGEPNKLAGEIMDAKGCCVTPGLIDCHTHLVYAGNRANEFELRLKGVSYQEIAKSGGGIQSTVFATRSVSQEELFDQSLKRAEALVKEGVTTIEIKSGYGLDFATEEKMLRVAKQIGEVLSVRVKKTFLGAHTLPKEYQGQADKYIELVCEKMLPKLVEQGLVDAVDVFCENIAFNLAQTEKVFQAAAKYNIPVKCHAEQLSDSGAAALAAKYHALSADHLEYLTESGVKAMAATGMVAVLLPGAFYFLRETKLPPIDLLRQYKIPTAIATDCNPGTSPTTSLLLMLNMASTLFRLTPEEALAGVTIHAAKALGLSEHIGSLTVGKEADFVLWDVKHPTELVYHFGRNPRLVGTTGGRPNNY